MTALASVTLPDNLYWADEFQWEPVAQSSERTLSGALVVEETAKAKGRPITLEGAWLDRTTVQDLKALADQAATDMTLELPDGRTFTVLFRRSDAPTIEAMPLFPISEPATDTLYSVTIRLMER